jgi:hypothetical protein
LAWKLRPFSIDLRAWCHGEMIAILSSQAHVPILSDIARRVCQLFVGYKITTVQVDPNREWQDWTGFETCAYDERTLAECARIYRCTVQDLLDLIAYIMAIPTIPWVTDHWLLLRMAGVDDL